VRAEHDSVMMDLTHEQDLALGGSGSSLIWHWAGGEGMSDMRIKDKLKLLAPMV
jgi:hypothetical protein